MGGQGEEDPLKSASTPMLFLLSGTGEGDKHVSGPRLSLSSSEFHPSESSSPGIASLCERNALYGPLSDPGETFIVLHLLEDKIDWRLWISMPGPCSWVPLLNDKSGKSWKQSP
jgi:hypothetical protein